MQGAWRAGTGVYKQVHEDAEHRATPQTAAAVVFQQTVRNQSSSGSTVYSTESLCISPGLTVTVFSRALPLSTHTMAR